jgi:hypothetical protein
MAVRAHDLWGLVWGKPQIDPDDLATAVEDQAREEGLDYRTRLLIRDSVAALKGYWGERRVHDWLTGSPAHERIEAICAEAFERPGFPTIAERLMDKTDPEVIEQLLRQLGTSIHRTARVVIGGSASLILQGFLSRQTEDIYVVDELPQEIRNEHRLLDRLKGDYGLYLAHFQSHYLPRGWENRVHTLGAFGQLQVALVDVYDVFLSKLFSGRDKDLNDLRLLAPQLDRETLVRKLKETTAPFRADEALLKRAQDNWYILFGEPLPQ